VKIGTLATPFTVALKATAESLHKNPANVASEKQPTGGSLKEKEASALRKMPELMPS
jgi:hypothetical protein